MVRIDLLGGGLDALAVANQQFGFALAAEEMTYLVDAFKALGRNPTDVELMMLRSQQRTLQTQILTLASSLTASHRREPV